MHARTWLLLMLLASPVAAQAPVTRGDTLGAHFDGSKVGTATVADFDFLLGDWTFTFQNRATETTWGPVQTGTWAVKKLADGLIEDRWTLGSGEPTLTWRSFNRARSVWELQGLKTSRGGWDPGLGWSRGDERFITQTFAGTTQAKIRYYRIAKDHFLWRADVSPDGGATWITDAWILEATRRK
jgi:hypothetical protein